MALTEAVQDYLEKLYWFEEARIEPTQVNLARAMGVSQPSVTEMVRRLVDEGLIERDERKRLHFTPHGREVAHKVVSRHRLIEAFLCEVFKIPWDEVHEEAHTFEHAISDSLEQRMYALLADAKACPHGHPIGTTRARRARPSRWCRRARWYACCASRTRTGSCLHRFRAAGLEPLARFEVVSTADETVRWKPLDDAGAAGELDAVTAGTISVRVEHEGEGAAATEAHPTGAQAALLGETAWGM